MAAVEDAVAFADVGQIDAEIEGGAFEPVDAEIVVAARKALDRELRWSPSDYQVRDATGNIIGRIKPMRVGAPSEAISVYCRHHGCSVPLRRTANSLSQTQIIQWFADGVQLGKGREFRTKHQNMYSQALRDAGLV